MGRGRGSAGGVPGEVRLRTALLVGTNLDARPHLAFDFQNSLGQHRKSQFAHAYTLDLVCGADFLRNLQRFSNRTRSRSFRGPLWAPEGRKSAKNQASGFIC